MFQKTHSKAVTSEEVFNGEENLPHFSQMNSSLRFHREGIVEALSKRSKSSSVSSDFILFSFIKNIVH